MDCNNVNLKQGSIGSTVLDAQTLLKNKGYYNGKIDGDYGNLTVEAVKKYQKANGLLPDGIFGPVTCRKINTTPTTTTTDSYYKNGVYHSGPHWVGNGCNKKGQCTGYYCALCALRQQLCKQGIDKYTQGMLAGYAGTTTSGTSHLGIETAVATVARKEGIKIKVEWKNFSDLGSTIKERFKALGELLKNKKKGIILHTLYKNRFGHYETAQEINTNNSTTIILNSLGNKCHSPAYCGYTETRSYNYLAQNMAGISQKSICILTFA